MKKRWIFGISAAVVIFGACHVREEIATRRDADVTVNMESGGAGGIGGAPIAAGMGGMIDIGDAGVDSAEGGAIDVLDPWRDSVAYYIFVDRFANGDPSNDGIPIPDVPTATNWQGGDWQGIIDKIKQGYFANLGVNSLWLGAPVDNPDVAGADIEGHMFSAYHGYWPLDSSQTEDHFGTMPKLQELVNEAHNAGMTVVLDYPANHVHEVASVYQQHPEWFWPNSNGVGGNCVCGDGCSWGPPTAERCWFAPYLPDFNYEISAARTYSLDNAIWWLQQTGIDGFRLGAIKHMYSGWLTEMAARTTSEIEPITGKHTLLMGSAAPQSAVDPGKSLSGTEDMELRASIATNILLRQETMQYLDAFLNVLDSSPSAGLMSTLLSSEYYPRSIHYAQDTPLWMEPWEMGKDRSWQNQPGAPAESSAYERLGIAYTILMTIPGIPTILYGDEIGLPGAGDPDNRRFMLWGGYSVGQVNLRTRIGKLGKIRKTHIALRRGKRLSLGATVDTMAYSMVHPDETVHVAINRSDSLANVSGLPAEPFTDLLTGQTVSGPQIQLPPRSAVILMK